MPKVSAKDDESGGKVDRPKGVHLTQDLHRRLKMRASELGIGVAELAEEYIQCALDKLEGKAPKTPTRKK